MHSKDRISYFLMILVVFFIFSFASIQTGVIGIVVLLILAIFKFRYSIFFYILLLPFWEFLGGPEMSLLSSLVIILFFSIRLLLSKENLNKLGFLIFAGFFIFCSLLGGLISGYFEYLHVTFFLIITILISYIISNQVSKNELNAKSLFLSFVYSGIIAILVSFINSEGDFRRLTLGGLSRIDDGSVRQLANIIGLSFVVLIVVMAAKWSKTQNIQTKQYFFYLFLCLILFLGLLMTNSRGVIFAVAISSIFSVLISDKVNIKMMFKKYFRLLIVLSLLFLCLIPIISFIGLDSSLELLSERTNEEGLEGGLDVRLSIWVAGLSNMSFIQVLFGHGTSSFKFLASQSGLDYYSHSVFVGIFSDAGLIAFLALILFMILIIVNIINKKTYIALPIFLYMILSYITHGGSTSQEFWILLALSYMLSCKPLRRSVLSDNYSGLFSEK